MILVVKLGGRVLDDPQCRLQLSLQISQLDEDSHRLVVVHGGGKQLSELCGRLHIPVIQHQGRRVTDEATLEAATMVFSAINRQLVAALLASGGTAVGISAYDGALVHCHRRPPIPITHRDGDGQTHTEQIDFGLVGEIDEIDTSLLDRLWEGNLIPVIACLGADSSGQILNINADTLAASLAVALQADRLISVSDVEGIYLDLKDPSSLLREISVTEAERLLERGQLADGMVPKVETALKVLQGGVKAVQIIGGLKEDTLKQAMEEKTGTVLWNQ